jgi:diaminohydroxyphosphoribosylaminopyrimidine deaminase / 5-amino-6-(5-phosphoribosylamino)uracil reductase
MAKFYLKKSSIFLFSPRFIDSDILMHEKYMRAALQEAYKGIYFTKPNPAVGCVIVRDNKIIARGYHRAYGCDHAEIDALKKIDYNANDCDMYVTLEPCAHMGKTPPCVDAIIRSGVKRVIIPFADPNPLVASKSIQRLKEHGIDVIEGILSPECSDINRFFLHFMKNKRPYVIAKWAMTAEGALSIENQVWISHPASREHTHLMRQQIDAILIGANTLKKDNPALTTRAVAIPSTERRHPLRIILSHEGDLPVDRQIFQDSHASNTLIACSSPPKKTLVDICKQRNITVFTMLGNTHHERLNHLLTHLGELNIMSLMIEGGAITLKHFFNENLVDEIQCYIAKGNVNTSLSLISTKPYKIIEHYPIESDYFIRATMEKKYV